MSTDLRELVAKATARSSSAAAKVLRLIDAEPTTSAPPEQWGLDAMRGRLVELSARGATATLTTAAELVLEAQRAEDPVAWVVPWSLDQRTSTFYPPDLMDQGIDLSALVVVRAPSVIASARAVERLLRSGAFGLVVVDFAGVDMESKRLPDHLLGRMVSLAQAHDTAVVCLTDKTPETSSLGSLVSLRAEAMRLREPPASEFEIRLRALKDKRHGPGWSKRSKARGPAGL
ncbi:MAG: recombinase A [Deltaproteobacteria bacterium]|nr:recombinase A [Deltaproteobacteria bacterium]